MCVNGYMCVWGGEGGRGEIGGCTLVCVCVCVTRFCVFVCVEGGLALACRLVLLPSRFLCACTIECAFLG